MKKAILYLVAIVTISGSALADVKIRSKQTLSGRAGSELTTYIKGKRSRTELPGGIIVSVTQCDFGRDLQINPAGKTYMVNLYDDGTDPMSAQAKSGSSTPIIKGGSVYVTTTIKDTGERKQMFGYTARHIFQTVEMDSSPDACSTNKTKLEMEMWVIDAEFTPACQQTRQYQSSGAQSGGCREKYVQKTLGSGKSGYPLWQKMTSYDASGKESFSMIQEVIEFSKATLDQALFEAPADYREVKDAAQLYSSAAGRGSSTEVSNSPATSQETTSSAMDSNLKAAAVKVEESAALGAKKPGTVRIGIAVRTGSVGEGITASDLRTAVQNTFPSYFKGTNVEIVPLEAKLAAAQSDEAKQKECDYTLTATASHKKGGGGFGGFGKVFSSVAPILPMGAGSAGALASQLVSTAINAASVSENIKNKDELSLDLKLNSTPDNSSALARVFKTKAKGDGDDIVSAVIEQAAQAIIAVVPK